MQTFFAGLSYYGILKFAYKDEVTLWPIIAAYAVGVAMNGFLPANIGTFVTLMMFVAIIPSCNVGGAIAAYIVQKIFFTLAGTFVYLYMFLSVPNSFDVSFGGNLKAYPWLTILIVAGGAVLIVIVVRIFWSKVKKLWDQAKQGGAILTEPKTYLRNAFLPSFLSWCCKIVVTGIFLAAFAIPVTFNSIMWVFGSGSLASVASFTPGAVGVTQATNALALDACCDVPRSTAIDYSTAQQLITTGWNQIVAHRPRDHDLRLDGRQAARHDLVPGREGPGSGHEGAARREEGGKEGGEGGREGRRAAAAADELDLRRARRRSRSPRCSRRRR